MTSRTTKTLLTLTCALALTALSAGCSGGAGQSLFGFAGGKKSPAEAAARRDDPAQRNFSPAVAPSEFGGDAGEDFDPYAQGNRNNFNQQFALAPGDQYGRDEQSFPPAGDYAGYQASRGWERLGGYDRPAESRENRGSGELREDGDNAANVRAGMNGGGVREYAREYGSGREGEEILYSAGVPQMAAKAPSPAEPVAKPFAGAHVGRSNFSKSSKNTGKSAENVAAANAPKPWENGHLFSEEAANSPRLPAVPNIYASRRGATEGAAEETMWPAGTAMAPPAGSPDARRAVPKADVRLPAPAAKAAAPAIPAPKPAAAPAPAPPADAGDDDEIFSPSMFLGGGR